MQTAPIETKSPFAPKTKLCRRSLNGQLSWGGGHLYWTIAKRGSKARAKMHAIPLKNGGFKITTAHRRLTKSERERMEWAMEMFYSMIEIAFMDFDRHRADAKRQRLAAAST